LLLVVAYGTTTAAATNMKTKTITKERILKSVSLYFQQLNTQADRKSLVYPEILKK